MHPPKIPILAELTPGKAKRHLIKLPGAALAKDEPRPVISVTGAKPGPVLLVNAGVHGGEYPAIEAVIRLGKMLDPSAIAGTVILMPVLSLPAFRNRTPFVCPVDNVNPNRVFPGDPNGSYSEQMTYALINEFVVHADAYIDLHGGDIPEALVPFCICRGGAEVVDVKSKELAIAFGLPYVLTVTRPVQPAKGLSSYAAVAERGIPAVLAEAGGVGQLQEKAVELLMDGVRRVMTHLKMSALDPSAPMPAPAVQAVTAAKHPVAASTPTTHLAPTAPRSLETRSRPATAAMAAAAIRPAAPAAMAATYSAAASSRTYKPISQDPTSLRIKPPAETAATAAPRIPAPAARRDRAAAEMVVA